MADDIIRVENLVKKFGELVAVADISFSVVPGEIFGFLGPNGAGKTTTINILCTLAKPTSGRAMINGLDVVRQQSQVRRTIGLVFQDPSLDERLSGWQNLRFHALVYGVPVSVREERMEQLLRMVELWDKRYNEVRTYSGGMKRRLELARGLLHHPRVLFLDEPTLGLDPQTRNRIWEYILELRRCEGTTIFLTTHYMDEADKADRIAIIDYGKLIAMDTPENLKKVVGKDIVTVKTDDNGRAAEEIKSRYRIETRHDGDGLCFEVTDGEEFLPAFIREFGTWILRVSLHRPSLDDVFLKLTGREIREEEVTDTLKATMRQHGRRLRR
ncbi:MAG: ABC transporter ATP-binding protein [Dehalococcoidales bacterium]|jgi:ABC-2 type transport system ATP-binding protein|nr:ABC transporter ATP-binding protein [Dehalococcoidales bacterium]MDP6576541.1 ATP-binding cassette domain-containing protein [Dehalococcoidales bacterium]